MVVTFGWLDNYVNFSSCYVITEREHALMLFCTEPATETIMHVEYMEYVIFTASSSFYS